MNTRPSSNEIDKYLSDFLKDRNPLHRYSSYDYCFNYFREFRNKLTISSKANIKISCFHLWYYLSSWGMIRASSDLIEKSLKVLEPVILTVAKVDPVVWQIDVDVYNDKEIRKQLKRCYDNIDLSLDIDNQNRTTLITKIMLGVFGCIPAYDRYFRKGMSYFVNQLDSKCGFNSFNENSLETIYQFYSVNSGFINKQSKKIKTIDYSDGNKRVHKYTKAKIIDMIGFCKGRELENIS